MAYLKYDTDKMQLTKARYYACTLRMEALKTSMQSMVDGIRTAWDSDAGRAFFDKYDNEWLVNFMQYKEVITHMADNLNIASGKYSEITQQANKLNIK